MATNHTYLCVSCRWVHKAYGLCPKCGESMRDMGYRWRAPKRTNLKAWRLIEAGDFMWDKKAIAPVKEWMSPSYWIESWNRQHPKHKKALDKIN